MSFSLSEYTKIDVGWGFAPEPTGRAYSTTPDPLAGFKGEWRGGEGGTGGIGEGSGKGGMGKGWEKGEVGGIAPWLLRHRRSYVSASLFEELKFSLVFSALPWTPRAYVGRW